MMIPAYMPVSWSTGSISANFGILRHGRIIPATLTLSKNPRRPEPTGALRMGWVSSG